MISTIGRRKRPHQCCFFDASDLGHGCGSDFGGVVRDMGARTQGLVREGWDDLHDWATQASPPHIRSTPAPTMITRPGAG